MVKIQIKSIYGDIIFEYEKENNTLKETVEKAVKAGANLSGANLNGASLYGANLNEASLNRANLSGANLNGASLNEAILNGASLPIFCKWCFGVIDNLIYIGCKKMSIEEWDLFFASTEEFSTKRGTKEFLQIESCYLAVKAYKINMEKLN